MENFDDKKIELYLNGQLSADERKLLATRIASDVDFAESVALHQLTMDGIEHFGLNQMHATITELDKELERDGFFLRTEDIDAYLDKKADDDTRKIVEKRLETDEEFRADFELHQLTKVGIETEQTKTVFNDLFKDLDKDLAQEGFFKNLDTKNEEIIQKEKKEAKIVRFPFQRLAIAASIALVIFAGWWVLQPISPNPEAIYANNFSPLTDVLSIELEETGFVKEPFYDLLEEGMIAYKEGILSRPFTRTHYEDAIDLFRQYRQTAPTTDDFYPTATLYLAISHLAVDEPILAIPLLERLAQQDFPQKIDAQWYLALSYIRTNQKEKAIPILKTLEQTKYQENVSTIISELQ